MSDAGEKQGGEKQAAAKAARLAAEARRRHRGGQHDEADRLYRLALGFKPDHAESLHGLGCLAHENGRPDLAIGLIGQAVAAAPGIAAYALSLGLALLDQGHMEPARAALHVAVLLDPEDPRAHRALAQALLRLDRRREALESLDRAIRLAPGSAAAHLARGEVRRAEGDGEGALRDLAEAARLTPSDPLAWHRLGTAAAALGAFDQTETAFRRVTALLPEDAAAAANLGTALFGLDRLEEARAALERAHDLMPGNPATLSSLGLVLMGLGDTQAAAATLSAAQALAPGDDAVAVNAGTALVALARGAEAERLFQAVLSRNARHAQARFNLATLLLARGERVAGWAAFEARRGLIATPGHAALPDWDGAPTEARVRIEAEQGLGDSIQFLRWVGASAMRAPVELALPREMVRLVRQADMFDPLRVRLAALGTAGAGYAARASLLSLPHLLGGEAVPAMTLHADPRARAGWRMRLQEALPAGLRVGLVWAGSPAYRFDRARSMKLAALAPLAMPHVAFVSLQSGAAASQAAAPPAGMTLFRPPPAEDLADTAALIAELDLVIGVDTAIVHLAGALGRPVWLLDRFGGDWRWQGGFAHGRDWYPTLRRFAQSAPASPDVAWGTVIGEVAAALRALVAPHGTAAAGGEL